MIEISINKMLSVHLMMTKGPLTELFQFGDNHKSHHLRFLSQRSTADQLQFQSAEYVLAVWPYMGCTERPISLPNRLGGKQ